MENLAQIFVKKWIDIRQLKKDTTENYNAIIYSAFRKNRLKKGVVKISVNTLLKALRFAMDNGFLEQL